MEKKKKKKTCFTLVLVILLHGTGAGEALRYLHMGTQCQVRQVKVYKMWARPWLI